MKPKTMLVIAFVLAPSSACNLPPAMLEGGDEADTTTGSEADESESSSSGADTDSETDTDSEIDTGDASPCDACEPGELCVAIVETDVCAATFGYTVTCLAKPASCAEDVCGDACVDELCGSQMKCVPECGFVLGVDVWCGWTFAPNECDPMAQDCPEGEKCVPVVGNGNAAWDANICVPIMGDAQPGEACTLDLDWEDDCALGSFCWANVGQPGYCQSLCGPEASCSAGQGCLIANEGVLPLCGDLCDPEQPDSCAESEGCVAGSMQGESVCVPGAQVTPQGTVCDELADCQSGFACVNGSVLDECDGLACCTSFCSLDDPAACDGLDPLECVAFYEPGMAPRGFENIGICAMP